MNVVQFNQLRSRLEAAEKLSEKQAGQIQRLQARVKALEGAEQSDEESD